MTGDHAWVIAAARQYEQPLLAYVRRLLNDAHRGEDIVQDAFLRLMQESQAEIEPRLGPWLFTVCRRRVIDTLRKENRMTALSENAAPSVASPGPAESLETQDTTRAVLQRLSDLPSQQQEAVRLKFMQQFSYREIAQVMGLSESHVGVLLHTALKTLRQSFAGSN